MTLLALLLVVGHTSSQTEQTCPLDGTKFKAVVDMSGTSWGMELDMKPVGPIAAPWAIPVCPKDHFPLYKEKFTPEELEDLKAYVKTPEYKALERETSYFLLAKVLSHRKAPALDVAHVLLKATWQVAGEARYGKYAAEALEHFKRALADMKEHGEPSITAQMVSLELERRTGRWDDAAKRLAFMRAEKLQDKFAQVIEQQGALIEKKDQAPHQIGKSP